MKHTWRHLLEKLQMDSGNKKLGISSGILKFNKQFHQTSISILPLNEN